MFVQETEKEEQLIMLQQLSKREAVKTGFLSSVNVQVTHLRWLLGVNTIPFHPPFESNSSPYVGAKLHVKVIHQHT